ncbi:MAG: hypothetical protein WA306_12220 [Candidatus Acidiferrales bacterium]
MEINEGGFSGLSGASDYGLEALARQLDGYATTEKLLASSIENDRLPTSSISREIGNLLSGEMQFFEYGVYRDLACRRPRTPPSFFDALPRVTDRALAAADFLKAAIDTEVGKRQTSRHAINHSLPLGVRCVSVIESSASSGFRDYHRRKLR